MKLNRELLEDLVENVIYPVEKLLEKELEQNGYDKKRAIKCLKKVGFLKIAICPFGANIDIDKIKQDLSNIEKLYDFPLDSSYIKELLGYFFDLLREFMKKRDLGEIDKYEKFCEIFSYLKSGNDVENQPIEDNEFFDFSEDQDNGISSMHYEDHKKISASEYMENSYIDFDLLEDISDLLVHYEEVSFKYNTFCDEFKMEVNEILKRFIALFELSGEFRDISKTINHLVDILHSLKDEDLEDSKKDILKLFLDAIMEDLVKWYQEVIELRSANDIHYLDASLLSSVEQIAQIFVKESAGGGTLFKSKKTPS